MFISDSTLNSALQDVLQKSESLESFWSSIITASNLAAYQHIQEVMAARGFTPAQLVTWDRGAEFERSIGLWWCLTEGGASKDFSDTFIKSLDRRQEVWKVVFTSAGVIVQPQNDGYMKVARVEMSSSNPVFTAMVPGAPPSVIDGVNNPWQW